MPGIFETTPCFRTADDLEIREGRHALALPDALDEVIGQGGAAVAADEVQRRAGAGHDELRRAAAARDGQAPVQRQRDVQRPRDDVIARREQQLAPAALHRVRQGRRVVRPAVAAGAEFANRRHGRSPR